MIALIAKELRQLKPIAFLWLALLALSIGIELFTARIDEQSYELFCDALCSPGIEYAQAIFLMILCLVTAYSLYPREVDERTIDFLHALPIKKSTIFYGKFIAAFGLVCMLLLFGYGVLSLLLAFNPESMSGKRYFAIDSSLFLRDCVFAFVVMAHGVFLSRFRTAGLIIYALYLLLIRWLETQFDGVGWVSVFEIFKIAYAGTAFSFSLNVMAGHVLVAIVMLVWACRMWSTVQGKAQGVNKNENVHRILKIVASVFAFLFVAMVLVGQVLQNSQVVEARATDTLLTDHYRFVFLTSDKVRAKELHASAEQQYQRLRVLLNASEEPVIHVNMTSENDHAAGLAQWKTIKMGLSGGESPDRYARVLNHETAHVFQSVESKRGFHAYFNSTRFFIEGMANYVSFEIVPQANTRRQNRDIAAVSWERQNIQFEDMTNSAAFSNQFNAELVYSLGEIWSEALVDICGKDALGEVLRSAGRDNAPQDLSAMVFWRDTLQHFSCELELVNAAWRTKLSTRFDNLDQSRFPILDNMSAVEHDNGITISLSAPLASEVPAHHYALRIAKESKSVASVDAVFNPDELVVEEGLQLLTFEVPSALIDHGRFRYQIGYQIDDGSRIYYQTWRSGSVF
ncbi:MAG: ABC transporter permease [Granulosicoccaceae bacterium]